MTDGLESLLSAIEERSKLLSKGNDGPDGDAARIAGEISQLAGEALAELGRTVRATTPRSTPPGQERLPVDD